MTEIGNSIANEYASELDEHIEDDKNLLRLSQGFELMRSVWRLLAVGLNLFFAVFLVLVVIVLFSIDAETLEAIRSATNEQIVNGVRNLALLIVGFTLVAFAIAVSAGSSKYFRDKRLERVEQDQREFELVRRIIEVNEEVLLRHGLIKAESSNNE